MKVSLVRPVLVALMVFSLLAHHTPTPVRSQAEPVTIAFQDGSAPSPAYTGTADAYLSQNIPATNYGGNSSLRVDGDEPVGSGNDLSTLLRWDISDIPADSTVTAASITIQVTNAAAAPYPVYPLLRSWGERQVTWNLAATGAAWQTAGALGANDRGSLPVGTIQAGSLGSYTFPLNADGLALVQQWVSSPAQNFGLIVSDPGVEDGLTFLASENATTANHPRLTITYLPAGGSIPTATPAPAATDIPVSTETPVATTEATDTPVATAEATGTTEPTATDVATETPVATAEATDTPVATSAPSPAPKYVILFIGDGMGFEHVRAAGMYHTGSAGAFSFESFPYRGELRTRSASTAVTDSAAAATALATGFNVNNDVISVASPGDGRELPTLLEQARAAGRKTGLVTTSFMTDATPAAFAAHELSRINTAAIAADFLNQTRPNVLLGGGGSGLTPDSAASAGYSVIEDRSGTMGLSGLEQYVSGQFTTSRMPYEYDGMGAYPHLSEMTSTALDLLDDDPDGFFLMVEGGLIDLAGHANHLQRDVAEVIELDNAVRAALNWAEGRSDTLIIVTADHETGGLLVTGGGGTPGVYPSVTWSTTSHTTKNVPIYAIGTNASGVYGVMENEDVPAVINGLRRIDVSFLPLIKTAIR